ncbi:BrnT family toxin [Terriglobus saanensis]|nr:BrnT family toxin [Terriglobus saanensis]
MDVYSTLDGQGFVWNTDKAASNASLHGVRFEEAREAFLDPLARYEDASPQQEARHACIGLTTDYRLLYVVHVIWEGDVLRLISARLAEPAERRRYEDD